MTRLRFKAGDRALTVPPHTDPGKEVCVVRVLSVLDRIALRWRHGWSRSGNKAWSRMDYETTPHAERVIQAFCADCCLMPLAPGAHACDADRDEAPVTCHVEQPEEAS